MNTSDLDFIRSYFKDKLDRFGPTPKGVDWNGPESQDIRFAQLAKIIDPGMPFSVLDYGCGYGALYTYLQEKDFQYKYIGYDLLESMVVEARRLHASVSNASFIDRQEELTPVDYSIASGIFNVRGEVSQEDWLVYTLKILNQIDALSSKGFAFNMLTSYSDPEYMRSNLYYADPCFIFDYCKKHYARNVALLHDYGLYDFTILVRKQVAKV